MGHLLAEAGPTPAVLDAIMGVLTEQYGYRHVSLHLLDHDGVARLVAQRGYAVTVDFDGTRGVIGRVMRTREAAFVPDVRMDPDYSSANPTVTGEICVPLLAHGELLGILNVESTADRPLDEVDRGIAATVGDRLAAALALARERTKLAERASIFQRLVEFSARINAELEESDLCGAVVDAVALVVPADLVGLAVLDRASSAYLVRAARGAPSGAVGKEIRPGEGMVGRAIQERALVRAVDHDLDAHPPSVRAYSAPHYGAAVGVPILHEGAAIGAMTLGRVEAGQPFTPLELEALELVANQTALALGKAFLHGELAELAIHDGLTGLPNRVLFMSRLEQALRRARRARQDRCTGVLFLDVDDFKLINDAFGHPFGDAVLIALARRLEAEIRGGDTVARLGGDEFTILLEGLSSPGAAETLAQRLLDVMALPLQVGDREVTVTACVGIAIAESGDATPDDLIADADIAMYAAKAAGRGRSEFFADRMRVESRRRLDLGRDLRRAIDEGELRVHYQPIFDLETMRMSGVEALVRWERPGHGLVLPGEFIPLAEATGLIHRLTRFVLETSCRQVRAWQRQSPGGAGLELSVNVSAKDFQPELGATVRAVLSGSGLDPACLKLEITESAVLDEADLEEVVSELQGLGVRFVVDDFGTGYSPLGYFKRFGISGLKLDRSLIRDLGRSAQDEAIVTAALAFARALDLSVTAEGIEEGGQLGWLQGAGCESGQGYHLARPITPETLEGLLVPWLRPDPGQSPPLQPAPGRVRPGATRTESGREPRGGQRGTATATATP